MKKVRMICIDDIDGYKYPDGIEDLDAFMEYAEKDKKSFIPLMRYDDINSPDFVEGTEKKVYVNLANAVTVEEYDGELYSAAEQAKTVNKVKLTQCPDCAMDCSDDDVAEYVSLHDNTCWHYEDGDDGDGEW